MVLQVNLEKTRCAGADDVYCPLHTFPEMVRRLTQQEGTTKAGFLRSSTHAVYHQVICHAIKV